MAEPLDIYRGSDAEFTEVTSTVHIPTSGMYDVSWMPKRSSGGLTFSTGGDAVGQEYHGYIVALIDGQQVGRLDYTYYQGELGIRMIEVQPEYQRQGIANSLLEELKRQDPNTPVYAQGGFNTDQGQAWLDKNGIDQWNNTYRSRVAMPVDPVYWKNRYADPPNNVLYHGTTTEKWPDISQQGLIPWDQGAPAREYTGETFEKLRPRPGHVYLHENGDMAQFAAEQAVKNTGGSPMVLAIDPTKLDPANINPDEDSWTEHEAPYEGEYPTPHDLYEEYWDGERSLGDQAEDVGYGDDPNHTQWGIEQHGGIAHRGVVPPEAIIDTGIVHPSSGRLQKPGWWENKFDPRIAAWKEGDPIEPWSWGNWGKGYVDGKTGELVHWKTTGPDFVGLTNLPARQQELTLGDPHHSETAAQRSGLSHEEIQHDPDALADLYHSPITIAPDGSYVSSNELNARTPPDGREYRFDEEITPLRYTPLDEWLKKNTGGAGFGHGPNLASWHEASITLPQEKRAWENLKQQWPSSSQIVHTFPNGYTIQDHPVKRDTWRVGRSMRNCWQPMGDIPADHPEASRSTVSSMGTRAMSLHDEHDIPRVAFYLHDYAKQPWRTPNENIKPGAQRYDYGIDDALGARNQPPDYNHSALLNEWANQNGYLYEENPTVTRNRSQSESRLAASAFFTKPHETLSRTFWKTDDQLRPDIRREIIEGFEDTFGDVYKRPTEWGTLWIIGSATSYQYEDADDDLDVQLVIDIDKFRDVNPEYESVTWDDIRPQMHKLTVEKIDGTDIVESVSWQLFVRPEHDLPSFLEAAKNLSQGCYDVYEDRWEIEPVKLDEDFDALEQFAQWIPEAQSLVQKAEDLIGIYRKDPTEGNRDILHDLYHQIREGRKESFDGDGGQFGQGNFNWQYMVEFGPMHEMKEIVGGYLLSSVLSAEDYWINHRAPGPEDTPIYDLEESAPDIYEHPEYYTTREPKFDNQSIPSIQAVRGNPNAMVSIHRASPSKVINTGDWVSTSHAYAKQHGKHPTDPSQDMKVWSAKVPANTLFWDGNSIHEYGYHGPPLEAKRWHNTRSNPELRDMSGEIDQIRQA